MLHGPVIWPVDAMPPNLRCPRNGKTDECPASLFCWPIQLSSLATETLNQGLGKAMKAVPSARIPANKVNACALYKKEKGHAFVTLMHWRGSR